MLDITIDVTTATLAISAVALVRLGQINTASVLFFVFINNGVALIIACLANQPIENMLWIIGIVNP